MVIRPGINVPPGLRWAANVAAASIHPIHKVGAVLVYNGNPVATGFNKNRTHPRSPHRFCIHAEVDVLLRNRTELAEHMTMYVTRITRGGSWGTSKPCDKCTILMREYGVEKIVYIDESGAVKKEDL